MSGFLVLDIETAPVWPAPQEPPESWLNKGVRENFKPETVEEHRRKNLEAWPDEWSRRAALDWRLGQIVAIGLLEAANDRAPLIHMWCQGEPRDFFNRIGFELKCVSLTSERDMLEALKVQYERHTVQSRLAGFNHRNFDLPWIRGRGMVHGVACRLPTDGRYSPRNLTDWSDILSNYGSYDRTGWTLDAYADLFDLDEKPWGQGADVGKWHQEGDYESIMRHLLSDLLTTWCLDKRCAPAFGLA